MLTVSKVGASFLTDRSYLTPNIHPSKLVSLKCKPNNTDLTQSGCYMLQSTQTLILIKQ